MSGFDVAGRLRSPATFAEFHAGRAPRNKGMRYLQGIDNAEIINAIHNRRPPMMPATAGLKL